MENLTTANKKRPLYLVICMEPNTAAIVCHLKGGKHKNTKSKIDFMPLSAAFGMQMF